MVDRDRAGLPVSVVIPTFQRRDTLQTLLQALNSQTLSAAMFEVVVGIDGSTDGTEEMLVSLEAPYGLQWVWQSNAGRAAACNAAIRRAEGDVVVILDDDMEPAGGLLEAHWSEHTPGSHRCVMGAVPIATEDGSPPHVRYLATKFDQHLARLARPDHGFQIRDFYSGNASVLREDLVKVGAFDERFRAYGNEDLELAYRLLKSGVQFGFCPAALARQHYEKTLQGLANDELAKGRTAVQFAATHPDALAGMKIAALARQPLRRRAMRRALLWAGRAVRRTPEVVLGAVTLGERLAPNQLELTHGFALDYFYALGVELETRERHNLPLVRAG
jgi:GT2 family glycosyltransferase